MHFKKFVISCFLLLFFSLKNPSRAELALLSEFGSERSTTGPGNNIVTHNGKTHVVWQDSEPKGYSNKIRTLDRATGTWSPTITLGPGIDNHARPCIAIDAEGFLHVVLGGHNTMMFYRRSLQPNDSSAWTKPQPIDSGTYPMLVCGPHNELVLAARPKTHSGAHLYVLLGKEEKWEARELVLKRNPKYTGYAGYNISMAWGKDGALHLSADVYEGRGSTEHRGIHQGIIYMLSRDLGKTWVKADGTELSSQVDTSKPDVLSRIDVGVNGPAQPARLRNGGVALDSNDQAYVYFTENKDNVSRAHLMRYEKEHGWRELPVAAAFSSQWPEYEAVGARGHLAISAEDTIYVLVEFAQPIPSGTTVERFSRKLGVGLLTSRDRGKTFEAKELIAISPAHNYTQANLERQTGHNDLRNRVPGMIVTDGLQRYPKKGEIINNKIFWLQP